MPTRVVQDKLAPLGYEQVTGLGAAKGLQSIPAGADWALIQAESQNVRWRDDGSNPTSSVGVILYAGNDIWYPGSDMTAIKFIEQTATAKLNVSYYRSVIGSA